MECENGTPRDCTGTAAMVPLPLKPAWRRLAAYFTALVRAAPMFGIDPHVRAGVERSASWLADAGYEVTDVEPPQIAEVTQAWSDVIGADLGVAWPLTMIVLRWP